uniref:Uncharacterized protein n=1 Tax=Tetranychus urticae TaxID=32264 RepID=T1K329_TETUR
MLEPLNMSLALACTAILRIFIFNSLFQHMRCKLSNSII